MKAVRITKDNKQLLEDVYEMSEGTLDLSSGLYLIAGFGNRQHEGLLTNAELNAKFFITGKKLLNDFFEVNKKTDYAA